MPLEQEEAVTSHRGVFARQEVGGTKLGDAVRRPTPEADGAGLRAAEALPLFWISPLAPVREGDAGRRHRRVRVAGNPSGMERKSFLLINSLSLRNCSAETLPRYL